MRATLPALTMAQVELLLVRDDADDGRQLWYGPQPAHLAAAAGELDGLGADERLSARLPDVLIRAAVLSGAAVRLLPDQSPVTDGVAALLRWA